MKKCYKCDQEKEESEFHKNSSRKDGLQNQCKECKRAFDKKYFQENREDQRKRNTATKKRNREYVRAIRDQSKCQECDEFESCCLDFHHIMKKDFNIASMVGGCHSISRIQEEIDKCIVLCSNCHRKVHAGFIKLK